MKHRLINNEGSVFFDGVDVTELCYCVQKLSIYGDGDFLSTLDEDDTLIDIKPRAYQFVAAPLPAKHAL